MSHFASQWGGVVVVVGGLSLLLLFQLHSPHLAAHSALKRSQRRLVPLLPNAGCYHDLVSKEGGAGVGRGSAGPGTVKGHPAVLKSSGCYPEHSRSHLLGVTVQSLGQTEGLEFLSTAD